MRPARRRVSLFILTILTLHAVPVARELTGRPETLWPFLAWGMFRHSSEPPVETSRWRLFARIPSGVRPVGPADAGHNRYAFRRYYRDPIAAGDSSAARDLARRIGRRWDTPVEAIVVEETRGVVEADGVRLSPGPTRVFRVAPPVAPPAGEP